MILALDQSKGHRCRELRGVDRSPVFHDERPAHNRVDHRHVVAEHLTRVKR